MIRLRRVTILHSIINNTAYVTKMVLNLILLSKKWKKATGKGKYPSGLAC